MRPIARGNTAEGSSLLIQERYVAELPTAPLQKSYETIEKLRYLISLCSLKGTTPARPPAPAPAPVSAPAPAPALTPQGAPSAAQQGPCCASLVCVCVCVCVCVYVCVCVCVCVCVYMNLAPGKEAACAHW